MDRPSPVPSPAGFVVKNGLNSFPFTSDGMPVPLSTLRVLRPQFPCRLYVFGVDNVGEKLKGCLRVLPRRLKKFEIELAERFGGHQVVFLAGAPCFVRNFLRFVHNVSDCGSTLFGNLLPSSADGLIANSS